MADYAHTQVGWLVGGTLAPVVVAGAAVLSGSVIAGAGILALAVAIGLLFGTLTVRVSGKELTLRFGVGLVRKRVDLGQVTACRAVRNPWYYGWGIRWIPGGVLYNVSGFSAVELALAGGRRLRVGTDEPEALLTALRPRLGSAAAVSVMGETAARSVVPGLALAVFLAIVLVVVTIIIQTGQRPVQIGLTDDALSVAGAGYSAEVPLASMTEVSLLDALPPVGRRTNGYAFGGTLRGHFQIDELGACEVFIERRVPPFIVIRTADRVVIVNRPDPEDTRRLYRELESRRGREPS
jgi:hypothetical protein